MLLGGVPGCWVSTPLLGAAVGMFGAWRRRPLPEEASKALSESLPDDLNDEKGVPGFCALRGDVLVGMEQHHSTGLQSIGFLSYV